jgi:glyoxylase-like metal-dependent hydrolase (beta-lactamase superfamily II)
LFSRLWRARPGAARCRGGGRTRQDNAELRLQLHLESAREAIRLFGDRLRAFEHDAEILPNVRTVNATGHTPGHTAILLQSRGERLLCAGDSFYDRLQLSNPGWWTPWDHDGERSVLSRRRLLGWAADENLLVHAYHLPFPGLGLIKRHGDAYEWCPVPGRLQAADS